jgi:hypothetical protein
VRSQFTRSRHNRRADQRLIRGNFGLAAGELTFTGEEAARLEEPYVPHPVLAHR